MGDLPGPQLGLREGPALVLLGSARCFFVHVTTIRLPSNFAWTAWTDDESGTRAYRSDPSEITAPHRSHSPAGGTHGLKLTRIMAQKCRWWRFGRTE